MFHRNVDVKKEVDCYTYFGGGDSGAGGGMISYMFPEALTLDISFDANEDLPPGYFDIDGTYGNGLIKGVVKVSSGSGVNVWHRGILITVLQSIVFHEPSPSYSVDLCRYEEILSEEGWMDEQSEFPFILVIRKAFEGNSLYTWRDKAFPKVQHIHSNALLVNDWFESFEGNTYSIRHTVIASVLRPWYAQTISVRAPLRLYRISVPNLRKLQDPVTLIVPDCGGKCVLELESRWIEIGGSTNVTVTLQNLKKPISSIFLMVIKCEFIEDIPCDRVVLVHRLLGWSMNLLDDAEISENAAYYEGYRSREDDSDDDPGSEDPVIRGAQFDFDLRFTELMDKAEEETPEGNEGQEVEYVNDTGSIASSSHSQRQPKPPNTLDFMSSMFPKESPIMPQRFGDRTLSSGSQQRPCSRLGSEKMAAAGEPDSGDDKAKRADSGKTLAKTDSMHSNNLFEAESMTDIFTPSFDTSFKSLNFSRLQGVKEPDIDMVSETASEDFDRSNDFKETGLYRIDSIGKHLDASRSRVPTSDDLLSASNDLRTHSKASLARSFSYKDDQKRSHRLSGADVNDREEAFFNFKGSTDSSTTKNLKNPSNEMAGMNDWKENIRDSVAVRYYLRVVVQDAHEKVCWNTTELMLYRAMAPYVR